jgi:hypothetical protein
MSNWDSRPVFFVSDVERNGCLLLLSCQEPQKIGHGRYGVLLDVPVYERA